MKVTNCRSYTGRSICVILHNYIPLGTRMRFGFPVSNIDVNALLESKNSSCTSAVFDKIQQHETKFNSASKILVSLHTK